MVLFLEITSAMLSILPILLAYAAIKAYFRLSSRFYLWLSIAFTLMTINDVIGRIIRYLVLNDVVAYDIFLDNRYLNIFTSLRLEFLGPGSMILILIGLLLHVLQRSNPHVMSHSVE